jgi:hypothetical protein
MYKEEYFNFVVGACWSWFGYYNCLFIFITYMFLEVYFFCFVARSRLISDMATLSKFTILFVYREEEMIIVVGAWSWLGCYRCCGGLLYQDWSRSIEFAML